MCLCGWWGRGGGLLHRIELDCACFEQSRVRVLLGNN